MAECTIKYRVRLAWRVKFYLFGVSLVSWMTLREPDEQKVFYWVLKGIKLEVMKKDTWDD